MLRFLPGIQPWTRLLAFKEIKRFNVRPLIKKQALIKEAVIREIKTFSLRRAQKKK